MKRPAIAALALLLLSHAQRAALADELPPLAVGTRLRVTTDHRLVGRLVAQDERSLTLQIQENKAPVVVPRTAISRVEESLRPGRKGRGALIGAALGAGAAAVLGVAAGDDCSGDELLCYSHGEVALVSAALLVPLGTLIGALASPGERWRPVSSGHRVGVSLAPVRGGIRASISVAF
jgi:hypothetical protein